MLLEQAGISYTSIGHTADEQRYKQEGSVYDMVLRLAHAKMEHAKISEVPEHSEEIFVLSADTISVDADGSIRGKPRDYEHARELITSARNGTRVSTGYCVRKLAYRGQQWSVIDEHAGVVSADVYIDIPDDWVDAYLMQQPQALSANGAIAVEGYGMQFVRSISGSHTAIIGLPLCEVRTALDALDFYT